MPVDQPEDLSKILKTLTEPSSERVSTALTNATVLLGTFNYAPDADNTFPEWYSRNQGILEECVESPSLRAKVLLKALGTEEYTRLRCHVSPAKPESKTFDELLGILNQLFGPTKSLFRRRFDILNIRSPAGTHPEEILNLCNLKGDEFEVNNLTADQFKKFLALLMATGPSFNHFRAVVLRTLDEKPGIDLLELREKVKQHVRRQEDATIGLNSVDENPVSINQVTSQRAARPPPRGSRQQPNSKCKGCEGSHFRSQCPFLKSKCNGCGKKGHLKKVCMASTGNNRVNAIRLSSLTDNNDGSRAFITLAINGIPVRLRVDSGADATAIESFAVNDRNSRRVLVGALFIEGITTALYPISKYLWAAHITSFFNGLVLALFEAGSYVAIANLWENPNFPLQLHMLGYGFAVFVVPFISEPFLSKSNPLDAGKLQQASVSRIYIPHAGIGALCVLLGIALAITTVLVPYPPQPTIAEKTDADTSSKKRDKVFETTLVIPLAVMSLFCVSLEMTFTGMISSFVIRSDLHLTKSDGAYLGGAFRATFFAGRIIILILHKLPRTLVIVNNFNLVSALVTSLIFVFFVLSSPYVVWVVNAGLGLGLCAIFGTDISWIFLALLMATGPSFNHFRAVVLRTLDEKPGIDLLELREKVKQHVRRQEDATIGLNSVDENPVSINQVTSQRAARPPPRGSRQQPDSKCKGCEGSHFRSQCPFLKSKCNGCGKKGHLKKTQFPKLFETSLGLCSKIEVDLRLKDNVTPTCLPARPLALPIRELVDKELERLLDNGTLYKVESSDWATPIVVVRKANGQIRMCADYSTGLNEALRDVDYPLPNMEEIMSRFSGNRIFTQLDLADAYLQLPLTAENRKLTTINTHRGLYQYNRLVFGLKTAPAIFQRTIDQALAGLEGVLVYLDDILVMAPEQELHDRRLRQVCEKLQEWGFHLRFEKCRFNSRTVKYLGLIISEKGIQADPSKVEAICNLREPGNVTELRSLLGLLNYYAKFSAQLQQVKPPFEALLKKGVTFKWAKEQRDAFLRAKELLSSPLLLAHFDPRQTLVVAADACDTGIGGVLLQRYADGNEKAVFHVSKSLSPCQRNYSQIEKEALALVSTVERLHKFIWGRRFILQTDHRPLVALFQPNNMKGLSERTAARLRRWALRLVGYDFHIEYVRTNDFGHADALSRLIRELRKDGKDAGLDEVIGHLTLCEQEIVAIPSISLRVLSLPQDVKEASRKDPVLVSVLERVRKGWRDDDCRDPVLRPFAQQAESLCETDGSLLLNDRLIVPQPLRKAVLHKLHVAHPGVRRMKALARAYFYWPGMGKDIEGLVKSCRHCIQHAANPRKIPLQPWPDPKSPWTRIHLDYAEPQRGKIFLVIVDSFSKYLDAAWMTQATSQTLIAYMRVVFRHFGPPQTIVSDNGPQFVSNFQPNSRGTTVSVTSECESTLKSSALDAKAEILQIFGQKSIELTIVRVSFDRRGLVILALEPTSTVIMKVIILVALVACSVAQCVAIEAFGAPNDNVDFKTRAVTPEIVAKAKELGKTDKVEMVKLSENTSTRYNLYHATLTVDGKTCHMTVSEEKPLKFLEQSDKNNCILCC
ncbi:uncharacterized protein LOC100905937 [Galendromus occidentalis]|uniref:RNA-directed DNA polymerase n=1 Tax=Galendromus occidentalis TaxID=34638 RepID=A0AAJ6W047_9ACAR|nr:uncharacterized protein LOC100905937 [Galendromus occidentalis]